MPRDLLAVQPRDLLASPVEQPSTLSDVATGAVAGLANAATGLAGLPGDAREAGIAGIRFLAEKLGAKPDDIEGALRAAYSVVPVASGPTSEQLRGAMEGVTGPVPQPQTTAGEFARTIGEFAPSALFPGTAVQRGVLTIIPALASETAGQLTEGTALETPARIAGAVAGGVTPSIVARAITPLPASRAVSSAVKNLKEEGVTSLTAGQKTGSQNVRALESELGGGAVGSVTDKGKQQFTAAVLKRVGIPKKDGLKIETREELTQAVDGAFRKNSGTFNRLTAGNELSVDDTLRTAATDALRQYQAVTAEAFRIPRITEIARDILNASGKIGGTKYQNWRSDIAAAARSQRDAEAANALRKFAASLDDAMERAIRASNPDQAGAFRDARRTYRNLLVIERAVTSAGQDAASGIINPRQLRAAAQSIGGRRSAARGRDDLEKLARSGEIVLTDLPNSGTPIRTRAQNLGSTFLGAMGAGVGGMTGGVPGGIAGAMLGTASPFVIGRAMASRPGRAFLGNQALTQSQPGLRPGRSALVAGGLASR